MELTLTTRDLRRSPGGKLDAGRRRWRSAAAIGVVSVALTAGLSGTAGAASVPTPQASPIIAAKLRHVESKTASPTPAKQMQSLNFLLGKYKCIMTPDLDSGLESGTGFTIYETTTKILGGNYYRMKFEVPGGTRGYQTFGWNPVAQKFVMQEFDDQSQSGDATSAGWIDSKLGFLGTYVFVADSGGSSGVGLGIDLTELDSWEIAGPGHHFDHISVINPANGQWTHVEDYDCKIVK
jgi:hypothetical protein